MRGPGLIAARWLALFVPLVLIAGALASQYLGGLFPCEMCHWQRWPHYGAIVAAALAFVVPQTNNRVALVVLAALLIALSGAIGVFHAGVEYRWWDGITGCSAAPSGGSGDLLADIMAAPLTRCDVPQWTLLGISLAGFNALFSLAGAVAILSLLKRKAH